jgi:Astacin (Peptidase family M12A)
MNLVRVVRRGCIYFAATFLLAAPLRAGMWRNSISPGSPPWPSGVIAYEFHSSVTPAMRPTYLACLREWELAANIHFVARTSEPTFLLLKYDPLAPAGSYSSSPPTLTDIRLSRFNVSHESGHALGLEHEHSRPDRDSSITVLTANIIPAALPKFDKYLVADVTTTGAYDFQSVMHYGRTDYSTNPATLNSIEPKAGYELYYNRLGNLALSNGDRATAAALYGTGPVLSPIVVNTNDAGVGSLRAAIYYANANPGTPIQHSDLRPRTTAAAFTPSG